MPLYRENLPTMYSLVVVAVARVSDDQLCSVVILLLTSVLCLAWWDLLLSPGLLLVCTFTSQWCCCSGFLSVTSDIFQWASNLCSVGAVLVSISSAGLSQAFGYCPLHVTLLSGRDGFTFWLWLVSLDLLPVWSFWRGLCLMAHGGRNKAIVHTGGGIQSSLLDLGKVDYQFVNKPDCAAFPQSWYMCGRSQL